jgi:hypothetical protein
MFIGSIIKPGVSCRAFSDFRLVSGLRGKGQTAFLVDGIFAGPDIGEGDKAPGDGQILEEHGELHLVRRVEME